MAPPNNEYIETLKNVASHQQVVINTRLTALQCVGVLMQHAQNPEVKWDAERAVQQAQIIEQYILNGVQDAAVLARNIMENKPSIVRADRLPQNPDYLKK